MIKKFVIMMAVAMMSFTAFADINTYDFKVNFKTLNVGKMKVKCSDNWTCVLDTPKVVSYKMNGYVVLEDCFDVALVYLKNKSGKIYRTTAEVSDAMFGKAGMRCNEEMKIINPDRFTDAQIDFSFPMEWDMMDGEGFLGRTNYSPTEYEWYFQGFGKVKKTTKKWTEITGNDCCGYTTEKKSESKYTLNNASGAMEGYTCFTGNCYDFIFDICGYENFMTVAESYLPGTFTLKFNKSIKGDSYADVEQVVLKKLGFRDGDVIYAPVTENIPDGLIEAETWSDSQSEDDDLPKMERPLNP